MYLSDTAPILCVRTETMTLVLEAQYLNPDGVEDVTMTRKCSTVFFNTMVHKIGLHDGAT